MIKPYIRVLPPSLGTRGPEAVALAASLGYTLDDEQKLVLNDVMATNEHGKLAAYRAGVSMPRQCGKSVLAEFYSLYFALQGEAVLYTSHRSDAARVFFRRLLANLPEEYGPEVRRTNGQEEVTFASSGGMIVFRTRGPRVGRAFTFDKLVVDEAQVTDEEDLDAASPTLRTRPDPQMLFLGCAANGRVNANCAVWYRLRESARRGDSEGLVYIEWSGVVRDAEGNELAADELTEDVLDDRATWERATPGYGKRVTEEQLRRERDADETSSTSFATECLNVWIPPTLDGAGAGPISLADWDALVDEESELDPAEPVPEVVVMLDMGPTRQCSICLAGRRADRLLHLDFVGRYEGAAAAQRAVEAICARDDLDVRFVVADGTPENLDLLARLRHDFVITERQVRGDAGRLGVQACAGLTDLVSERKFRHRGQHELRDSLRGAVVKQLAESWVYSRSRSRSDVSPLLAAAGALWVADVELAEAGGPAMTIYG